MKSSIRKLSETLRSTSRIPDTVPVSPDAQTFKVKLKALRESGASAQKALAALEEMRYMGPEADHINLLTLAYLCCRREEIASVEQVLEAATNTDVVEYEKLS